MHVYKYRSEDRFEQPVISMAILVDDDPDWRPTRYVAGFYPIKDRSARENDPEGKPARRRRRYRAERTLRFLTVKLLDFRGREAELEALDNPMGLFVVANLEAMRTRDDEAGTRGRSSCGFAAKPPAEEDGRGGLPDSGRVASTGSWKPSRGTGAGQSGMNWNRLDKEQSMPFVSYAENRGMEKGLAKGLEKGTKQTLGTYLKAKFPEDAPVLLALLEQVEGSEAHLEQIGERIFLAGTADEVRSILVSAADVPTAQP